jgi:hypothetical protein
LIAWVARSNNLDADAVHLPTATMAHPMQRGELHWTFLFTRDGSRIAHGLLPNLIAWDADTAHPATRLPDNGCTLMGLRGFHPDPQPINHALAQLQLNRHMVVRKTPPLEAPKLQAMVQTPSRGLVVLES